MEHKTTLTDLIAAVEADGYPAHIYSQDGKWHHQGECLHDATAEERHRWEDDATDQAVRIYAVTHHTVKGTGIE